MANKITKKDRFNQLLAIEEVKANEGLVEFIAHEIELLEKKNGSEKKPTKDQLANAKIKEELFTVLMECEKALQIKEIQKLDGMGDYSNQKLSALLKQMVADGEVIRTEEKKVAYFEIA